MKSNNKDQSGNTERISTNLLKKKLHNLNQTHNKQFHRQITQDKEKADNSSSGSIENMIEHNRHSHSVKYNEDSLNEIKCCGDIEENHCGLHQLMPIQNLMNNDEEVRNYKGTEVKAGSSFTEKIDEEIKKKEPSADEHQKKTNSQKNRNKKEILKQLKNIENFVKEDPENFVGSFIEKLKKYFEFESKIYSTSDNEKEKLKTLLNFKKELNKQTLVKQEFKATEEKNFKISLSKSKKNTKPIEKNSNNKRNSKILSVDKSADQTYLIINPVINIGQNTKDSITSNKSFLNPQNQKHDISNSNRYVQSARVPSKKIYSRSNRIINDKNSIFVDKNNEFSPKHSKYKSYTDDKKITQKINNNTMTINNSNNFFVKKSQNCQDFEILDFKFISEYIFPSTNKKNLFNDKSLEQLNSLLTKGKDMCKKLNELTKMTNQFINSAQTIIYEIFMKTKFDMENSASLLNSNTFLSDNNKNVISFDKLQEDNLNILKTSIFSESSNKYFMKSFRESFEPEIINKANICDSQAKHSKPTYAQNFLNYCNSNTIDPCIKNDYSKFPININKFNKDRRVLSARITKNNFNQKNLFEELKYSGSSQKQREATNSRISIEKLNTTMRPTIDLKININSVK